MSLTLIFPAAGFGRRIPQEPVKELMLVNGSPLIELSFHHVLQAQNEVHEILILTRQAKLEALSAWLDGFRNRAGLQAPVDFVIHEPGTGEEWPLTCLASAPYWTEKNLVLLPDTRVVYQEPLIPAFERALDQSPTVWGISRKDLSAVSSYGMADREAMTITEKPNRATSPWVWGCFGFQKSAGRGLFLNLEKSTREHAPFGLPVKSAFLELSAFEDLARAWPVARQGSNSSHS